MSSLNESHTDDVNKTSPQSSERMRAYKNNALDSIELRRRREEDGIQLRKQRRDELLRKRRNLDDNAMEHLDIENNGSDASQKLGVGDGLQDPTVSSNTAERVVIDPGIISDLQSSDVEKQLNSIRVIRHILSRSTSAPINEVINSGVVPRLVELLDCHNMTALQFEATWCLTNICSGDIEQTRVVVVAGAIPKLVDLLKSSTQLVSEQSVWAMGNIAGNGPAERDLLLDAGCVSSLTEVANCVENLSPQMLRNISWCIVNLVRYKRPPAPFDSLAPFLPCLACFIQQADTDVLVDTCWAIAHLANGSNEQIQAIISAGVCERLVALLLHPHLNVSVGALRAVGNLVTGDDQQTQVLLDCGLLNCLRSLLESGNSCCHKEVCWALSNITAGNSSQVEMTMRAGLFPLIVQNMSHGDFKLRKEAAWSIVNASLGGLPEHVHVLVADGCLQPLCQLLSVDDLSVVTMAITGIEAILRVGESEAKRTGTENVYALKVEECGGLDRIEFLQMHPSVDVYQRSCEIIDRYFGICAGEADSTVSPTSVKPPVFDVRPTGDSEGGFEIDWEFLEHSDD